jgi:hypothetical protein
MAQPQRPPVQHELGRLSVIQGFTPPRLRVGIHQYSMDRHQRREICINFLPRPAKPDWGCGQTNAVKSMDWLGEVTRMPLELGGVHTSRIREAPEEHPRNTREYMACCALVPGLRVALGWLIGRHYLPSIWLTPCMPPVYPLYTPCIPPVLYTLAPGFARPLPWLDPPEPRQRGRMRETGKTPRRHRRVPRFFSEESVLPDYELGVRQPGPDGFRQTLLAGRHNRRRPTV